MNRRMVWIAALLLAPTLAADARIEVARFSQGDLDGWERQVFVGETRYAVVSEDGGLALRADSDASASGLVRRIRIDLDRTPWIDWSWKVGNVLAGNDERTRVGDDYPARIYVIFSGGLLFWRTRAINYVWSSHQPAGTVWHNAYTANSVMIAVDSGAEDSGRWVTHRRNVRDDYRLAFGHDSGPVDGVAIMTDTDNTGQQATAWYGDIFFSMHPRYDETSP